jgi:hypothetical protein
MAQELMSLADASVLLGLSAERVRQLVVAGQLAGIRFGNVWVVPRDVVIARRHQPGRRGRPLSPVRAWEELVAGPVDLRRAGAFLRRAVLRRCEMSRADLDAVRARFDPLVSGVHAASEYGERLPDDDRVDLYVSRANFRALIQVVAAVDDPLGPVALRVVDDAAWTIVRTAVRDDEGLAPRGAVALDLLGSADPRHWIAAEHLADRSD